MWLPVGARVRAFRHSIGSNGIAVEKKCPAILSRTSTSSGFIQSLEANAALPLEQITCRVPETRHLQLISEA
jgi:hypothetical protein